MAELALYGNSNEPEFPFDKVVDNVGWLGSYLSRHESAKSGSPEDLAFFSSLLDTVLVWSRARTAGFQLNRYYPDCKALAVLLNAALEQAGGSADYHRLEFVRSGQSQFFITCRNSPRFIWKTRFTHLEIGKNIDYCAAGHIGGNVRSDRRASAEIWERTTFQQFTVEVAFVDSLRNPMAKERWVQFNHAKEQLYNDTMERLGLKYRFKLVFEFPETPLEVHQVMTQERPPTAGWWDDNCPHLTTLSETGKLRNYVFFCNFDTKFEWYWDLIQSVYLFGLKYFPLVSSEINSHCGFDFEARVGLLTDEIWRKTVKTGDSGEYELLMNHIRQELSILAAAAEEYLRWMESLGRKLEYPYRPEDRGIGYCVRMISYRGRLIGRGVNLHILERWKLRQPLVYEGIPIENVNGCWAHKVLDC